MDQSVILDDHETNIPDYARSYTFCEGEYKKSVSNLSDTGSAGLVTTVGDMMRWARNFVHPVVGSPETIARMNRETHLADGSGTGAALGQFHGDYQGHQTYYHTGSYAGYRAILVRIPSKDYALIVLSNAGNLDPFQVVDALNDLFLSKNGSAREEPDVAFDPFHPPSISITKEQLQSYCGVYWEPVEGYERKILFEEGVLVYHRREGDENVLRPIGEHEFIMMDVPKKVIVAFQNGGMRLTLSGDEIIDYIAIEEVSAESFTGRFQSDELHTHYEIIVSEERLWARHHRLGELPLRPINRELVVCAEPFFSNLHFKRNANGKVIAFHLTNDRNRNQPFVKVP